MECDNHSLICQPTWGNIFEGNHALRHNNWYSRILFFYSHTLHICVTATSSLCSSGEKNPWGWGNKVSTVPTPISVHYTQPQTLDINLIATFYASSIYCDVNLDGPVEPITCWMSRMILHGRPRLILKLISPSIFWVNLWYLLLFIVPKSVTENEMRCSHLTCVLWLIVLNRSAAQCAVLTNRISCGDFSTRIFCVMSRTWALVSMQTAAYANSENSRKDW
jgi:hypothetical protein